MHTESDHELALKAKAGDESAFNELMRRHYKGILNFIYKFTYKPEICEDLTQEVFLRVYKSINTYEPQAKFSTWLYKIATNLCLTNLKKKNLNISLDEIRENIGELEDVKSEDAQNLMQRKQLNERVMQAISTLPEKERLAITLCKYHGLSYLEVSEALDCSVGAVKTHIFRGRAKLVDILKPHLDEIN